MRFYKGQPFANIIIKLIKYGSDEEVEEAIADFLEKLKNNQVPASKYQPVFIEVMSEMFQLLYEYQLEPADICGQNVDFFSEIGGLSSLEAIEEWMKECCYKIRLFIRKGGRKSSVGALTEKAKKYIEGNYADHTLSVEKLCSHLNISTTHFSVLFKKEFGMSFISYLTKIRMEQAAELLEHTEDKSYIIAEKVGYTEANYFSSVFKKHYGVSPKKYRINLEK